MARDGCILGAPLHLRSRPGQTPGRQWAVAPHGVWAASSPSAVVTYFLPGHWGVPTVQGAHLKRPGSGARLSQELGRSSGRAALWNQPPAREPGAGLPCPAPAGSERGTWVSQRRVGIFKKEASGRPGGGVRLREAGPGGAWPRLTQCPPWRAPRHGEARSRGGAAGDCGPSTPSCAGSGGTRCAPTWQSCIGGSRLRGSPHSMAATLSGRHPPPCCSPSRTPAKCSSPGTCPRPAPTFPTQIVVPNTWTRSPERLGAGWKHTSLI